MNIPKRPLDCRNCEKWPGKLCQETGVVLPCDIVTVAIEEALDRVQFERGFDTSSNAEIAGRFAQLGTFSCLRIIGQQACSELRAEMEITV